MALGSEYKRRYGRTHMSIDKCGHLHKAPADIPHEPFEQPPQAMPDEYKDDDPVVAYRAYYKSKVNSPGGVHYRHTSPPDWWEVTA